MKNLLIFVSAFLFLSCTAPNPNEDVVGQDELKSLEIDHKIKEGNFPFKDVIYVPIYSDIYTDHQNQKVLLAATLSIRNTNYEEPIIISKIDYFDTDGNLVREFIEKPLRLPPMATVNYVIEKDDDTGGTGANFIVELSAESEKVKPLIQAVMIGQIGNKGFAFCTDGYSIH